MNRCGRCERGEKSCLSSRTCQTVASLGKRLGLEIAAKLPRGLEVDEAFEAVHFGYDDVEFGAEFVARLASAGGEGGSVRGGGVIGVVARGSGEFGRRDKAKGHRLLQLDEEAVRPDFGDDGGESRGWLFREFALEEFHELHFHTFALGFLGIGFGEAEVFAEIGHLRGRVTGFVARPGGLAWRGGFRGRGGRRGRSSGEWAR